MPIRVPGPRGIIVSCGVFGFSMHSPAESHYIAGIEMSACDRGEKLPSQQATLILDEVSQLWTLIRLCAVSAVSQGVELGLLQREADPDDARRTLIALTDKGRAISNRFRGAQRESVDLALESFSEEERALLTRLLSRLADAWPK